MATYCAAWPCPHTRPCPVHGTQRRRTETSEKVRASKQWKLLRLRILARDPYCVVPGCQLPSTDVDHVLPIEDGGDPYDEANLQGLCHAHHSQKTAEDVKARRAGQRAAPEPDDRPRRPTRRRRRP